MTPEELQKYILQSIGGEPLRRSLELNNEADKIVNRFYERDPWEEAEGDLISKAREVKGEMRAARVEIVSKLRRLDAKGRAEAEEMILGFLEIYRLGKKIHEDAVGAGVETGPYSEPPPDPATLEAIRRNSLSIHLDYVKALRCLWRDMKKAVRRFRWRFWRRRWIPRLFYLVLALLVFWLMDLTKEVVVLNFKLAVATVIVGIWAIHELFHHFAQEWLREKWHNDLQLSVHDLYGVLVWLTYFRAFLDHELNKGL